MSVIGSNILAGASGQGGEYTIEESLRFNASQSSYLSWTPASAGNRKTWTWSGWVKRGQLGTHQNLFASDTNSISAQHRIRFSTANTLDFFSFDGSNEYKAESSAVYRDISAWYHVVVVYNTTSATANDRMVLYVNGARLSLQTNLTPTQNYDGILNNNIAHNIGRWVTSGYSNEYLDGYLTEVNFIDGQALDASSFGETDATTGVWKPKGYTGTYGTNGFYLPMKLDNTTEGFNTVTYLGNGSTNKIGGVGFSPDLVWLKGRSVGYAHGIYDAVRGATKKISSNSADAEITDASGLTAFNSDGFTLGSDAGTNQGGASYVAWCWDAGNTTVSNTDGSITSSVRANPTYGFSVVTYSGNSASATVGHSLGTAPSMVIVKARSGASAQHWRVLHSSLNTAGGQFLTLSTTGAVDTASSVFDATAPTSSVFSVGANNSTNGSGYTYIAYCFSEVSGYSKFGSYTGTGAAGNVVTTGFKPAFLLIKGTTSVSNWVMVDNTRTVNNSASSTATFYANASLAESAFAANNIDFNDDGFTLQHTPADGYANASGETYIYMAFKDTREYAFWLDDSGNNNDWQPNGGITTSSTVTDTPTPYLGGGNYAVLNPLAGNTSAIVSNANLRFAPSATAGNKQATIGVSSGKWYWELTITSLSSLQTHGITSNASYPTDYIENYGYNSAGGKWIGYTYSAYGASYTTGDVISFALDMDAGTLTAYKNNSSQGILTTGLTGTMFPLLRTDGTGTIDANFGQRPFAYTPPTGFLPLHTGNLPDSSIVDGSTAFDVVTYTGTGTTQSITGLEFQPDFTWIKSRNNTSWHSLDDAVRGAGKTIFSNTTDPEYTYTNAVTSFNPDGFSLGEDTEGGSVNVSARTYVAWNWKANGTGVSNTDGSITSTVSANPTAGFSVASWVSDGGATPTSFGHGLGVAPNLAIIKSRGSAGNWQVYSSTFPNQTNDFLVLNSTDGKTTAGTAIWGTINSSVFSFRHNANSSNGDNMVGYFFAEVEGYSKFGSYTGNGSTDGPFVHLGFRPAFVMFKRTDSTSDWAIYDTARETFNVMGSSLYADLSIAELSSPPRIDMLSNGFKLRTTGEPNWTSGTVIFMAFAETDFAHALAR